MSKSFLKGQVSVEFYITLVAILLSFLIFLAGVVGMKNFENEKQVRLKASLIGQNAANAVESMQRNLCNGLGCSTQIMLPEQIQASSFAGSVQYSINFSGNTITVAPQGYAPVTVLMSVPANALNITVNETGFGKLVSIGALD